MKLKQIWSKLAYFHPKTKKKEAKSTLKRLQEAGIIKNQDDKLTWEEIYDIS